MTEQTQAIMLLMDGFEDAEAIIVLDFLRRMELNVKTVSCTGSKLLHSYWGVGMHADLLLSELGDRLFAGVILVGGPKNTSALEQSPLIVDYIARHGQAGKLVAAVCSAPAKVLGWHHLLKGRNYVCSSELQETVDASEGTFVDQGVVISGNLITCKGLGHCFEFGAAIARALGCDLTATKTQHEHIYCAPHKLEFLH